MTFDMPNAAGVFDIAAGSVDDAEGHSSDILGHEQINTAVDETVKDYNTLFNIGLRTSARDRHRRLGGLAYGKINQDIARLKALADAVENISTTVKAGKQALGYDWQGESYEAFKSQIEKVEKTLDDYAGAVQTTADGLEAAMSGIVTAYQQYRTDCLDTYFNWGPLSPPGEWWRMSQDSGEYLEENCSCGAGCEYNEEEHVAVINNKLTNRKLFDGELVTYDCMDDSNLVFSQYKAIVEKAEEEQSQIEEKITAYCNAADALHVSVGDAYDAALENLRVLSEVKVFSRLQLGEGTPSPSGGDSSAGTDSGGGGGPSGGGGGGGGGSYPSGGSPGMAMPPVSTPEPVTDPAAVAPVPEEPTAPAGTETPAAGETVEIKDADRTIAVASPDGQGHVRVTVENADGTTKSYDLDFDAASGLLPFGAETPEPAVGPDGQPLAEAAGAEQVPARTDGKCVIEDGPLTITAERPLFAPDSIRLVVDDGTGEPSSYLVDFEAQPEAPADAATAAAPVAPGGPPSAPAEVEQPAAEVVEEPVATPEPSVDEPAAAVVEEPAPEPGPAPNGTEQVTAPQALSGDDNGTRGAMSGQLSGDIGSAQLAGAEDAPNAPAAGMASGMPMLGNAGDGQGEAVSRAGSGWSVHGDLFDSAEPVYSMHGVLGDDDSDQQ